MHASLSSMCAWCKDKHKVKQIRTNCADLQALHCWQLHCSRERVYSVSFLVLQGTRSIIKNSHILLSFNYSTLHPNSTINFYNNISIRIHTFKEGFCFLLRSKFYCKKNVFFEEILNFLIVKDNKSFLFKKGIEQLYILDACLLLRGRGK